MRYLTGYRLDSGFPEEFKERRGYSTISYLPFIGLTDMYRPPCDVPGYELEKPELSERQVPDGDSLYTKRIWGLGDRRQKVPYLYDE